MPKQKSVDEKADGEDDPNSGGSKSTRSPNARKSRSSKVADMMRKVASEVARGVRGIMSTKPRVRGKDVSSVSNQEGAGGPAVGYPGDSQAEAHEDMNVPSRRKVSKIVQGVSVLSIQL